MDDNNNFLELYSNKTDSLLDRITIDSNSSELTIYAMEYFDKSSQKWKLKYTIDKLVYDNYIKWTTNPNLTEQELKSREELFQKLATQCQE